MAVRPLAYLADVHHWTRFISIQNHYNLVYREEEREMLPLCRVEGTAWLRLPWPGYCTNRMSTSRSLVQVSGST